MTGLRINLKYRETRTCTADCPGVQNKGKVERT